MESVPKIITDEYQLHQKSRPVEVFEPKDVPGNYKLIELAKTLVKVMQQNHGRGLAAPQIGERLQVLVMLRTQTMTYICIVNPRILETRGLVETNEECLSLPGKRVPLKRPKMVKVEGYNQYGVPVRHKFEGPEARCLCHEYDHLQGVLITDKEAQKWARK